jgi:hypothetical protein
MFDFFDLTEDYEPIETFSPKKVHEQVIVSDCKLTNQPIMIYDEGGNYININIAVRAGISKQHNKYVIWFDDGEKKRYMMRAFFTEEEAKSFLEYIYQIIK